VEVAAGSVGKLAGEAGAVGSIAVVGTRESPAQATTASARVNIIQRSMVTPPPE
jgi:hypothetical protein